MKTIITILLVLIFALPSSAGPINSLLENMENAYSGSYDVNRDGLVNGKDWNRFNPNQRLGYFGRGFRRLERKTGIYLYNTEYIIFEAMVKGVMDLMNRFYSDPQYVSYNLDEVFETCFHYWVKENM